MIKIVTIIGARPQFIKAAALSKEFKQHSQIQEIIIHTGQHFDENMSAIFFDEMHIPKPQYQLNINSLGHGAMTGRMLEEIEKILVLEKPVFVLVYGDTNSTLAGALAAKKLNIKVIHVEAGLRSFNMAMPEEINRILTDRISDICFCPTENAVKLMKEEANKHTAIVLAGDVMEDAALFFAGKSYNRNNFKNYVLATIHRQENTDDLQNLSSIIEALNVINENTQVVIPLHPRTRLILEKNNIIFEGQIIEPVGYLEMIDLIQNANLIITDSGGLQKEAFFFDKYCITIREQTEWIELVEHGYNFITGSDKGKILECYLACKDKPFDKKHNFYGGGNASKRIAEFIIGYKAN